MVKQTNNERSRLSELMDEYNVNIVELSLFTGIPETTIRSLRFKKTNLQLKAVHAIKLIYYFDYNMTVVDLLPDGEVADLPPRAVNKIRNTNTPPQEVV